MNIGAYWKISFKKSYYSKFKTNIFDRKYFAMIIFVPLFLFVPNFNFL